jgi:tetratricopeptide (TPR) repeat protein
MPVIRRLYLPALIPQLLAIAALGVGIHFCFPRLDVIPSIAIAAIVYPIFCRVLRETFAHDHAAGMRAYKAQHFEEAISHFEASYRFFLAHPLTDKCRSLLFGVATQNPYRVIALCNMAYCYTQIGNGNKAIELFEQALQESPECTLARTSLSMLRSVSPVSDSKPAVS